MRHCSIALLGTMLVRLDGRPLEGLESAKVRSLLAYLAVENTLTHSRDRLSGLFWPEMDNTQAHQNLSQSIYNLRHTLGETGKVGSLADQTDAFILVTPQTVQFNPLSDFSLDVLEMDHLLTQVRKHSHARLGACESCFSKLQSAIGQYHGEFLSGISLSGCREFEEWTLIWREKAHSQYCDVLSKMVACYENQGEKHLALETAQCWLREDSYSEPALCNCMRLLALDRQRTNALAIYNRFKKVLMTDLGVEPGSEPALLYRRILADETLKSAPPGVTGWLPVPLTNFIGREKELNELSAILRDTQARLITVLGPGGSGKTRLALEAARLLRFDFPDGLFLVSLSGLTNTDAFLPALANALGMVFQANWGDPFDQICGYLQHRNLLLILDSFEELPSIAGRIPSLLQSVPDIKILVTSRVRINLQPEQVFPLGGMTYPETRDPIENVNTEKYSALQLFLSASRMVKPDYEVKPGDISGIVRICKLVDGMPLGLVLSAGWIETCSPGEIAVEIENSLDFLSSSWSDVPERQRSLRATIDHSWRLLSPSEQQAFHRLSVFQGTFTRQAAERVAEIHIPEMRALVDKSMLLSLDGKYRMHDLLRQYAAEKLEANANEAHHIHAEHCAYFLQRIAIREPRMKSAQRSAALVEMDAEMNDVQAVWKWACDHSEYPLVSQSLEGLEVYFDMRVRYLEGKQTCLTYLESHPIDTGDTDSQQLLRARFLIWLATFQNALGEIGVVSQLCSNAGILLDQLETQGIDVRSVRARYWEISGNTERDIHKKIEAYERAIALYRSTRDTWRLAELLRWNGEQKERQGYLDLGLKDEHEALNLASQLGEPYIISKILIDLAYTYFILNRGEDGREMMKEAATFIETTNDLAIRGHVELHLGVLSGWDGRFEEAVVLLEHTVPLVRKLGYRYGTVYGSLGLGIIYLMVGRYGMAESILKKTLFESEQGGFPREHASTFNGLCMVELAKHNFSRAIEYIEQSISLYKEMKFSAELGWAFGAYALALEEGAQPERAEDVLLDALRIAEQTRSMFTSLTCLPAEVNLLYHRGHLKQAFLVHCISIAQPIHKNSHWYQAIIDRKFLEEWESLPDDHKAEIRTAASQHTPFTNIHTVRSLLEPCGRLFISYSLFSLLFL